MICKKSFNVVNAAHAYCVIGCCSRSNGVQTHRWRQNLFSLFCSRWRVVFRKCLRDYFGLSKWRSRKKLSRSCLHVRNTEKPTQKSSWRLLLSLVEEIFTTVASGDTRSLENVCTIILVLWASEGLETRPARERLSTSKIKKKRKSRDET